MIIEVRAENCYAFDERVCLSLKADMRNKKFKSNVHQENHFNILKAVGIYGPNNSGKTCLIKCIREIRNILLNKRSTLIPNIFTNSTICKLGVTFLWKGRKFSYDFSYDIKTQEFIFEEFLELTKDKYNNELKKLWLLKDEENNKYFCLDNDVENLISLVSKNNLLVYVLGENKFAYLDQIRRIIIQFASKIDIVNMNNIPMQHTIELMKHKNDLQHKIVDFIKNSDLYMDNFEYADGGEVKVISRIRDKAEEKVLNLPESLEDQLRLVSTYKGHKVPSILFDSTGTKKITALASCVIEALEQGRILVIDELDSSIHFKLTRAIVNLFNNELNDQAQLICTVHDINLMDCNRMFRKEQVWFVHKDKEGVYVYSLADFTAQDGIRQDTTDIMEKYRQGVLGALPDPDLLNSLLDIKTNTVDEEDDEE